MIAGYTGRVGSEWRGRMRPWLAGVANQRRGCRSQSTVTVKVKVKGVHVTVVVYG